MDFKFDLTIIGGGIIGLATAMDAVLRFPNLKIAIVEKENDIVRHQSGHNSGVIHSGIYYRPGSLKARNCVAGASAMVQFCRTHDIPFEICGKVVVATSDEQKAGLQELMRRGTANGVPDLAMITPEELRELEPHCAGVAALRVPGTGIVDYKAVAHKYSELIVNSGGQILTDCRVNGIKRPSQLILETTQGSIETTNAVNCAGLHSDRVARLSGGHTGLQIVPFRGEYYDVIPSRQHLVRNLIYPVADPHFPFLGVHFTRRITGEIEAGPNAVLAFKREGYRKTDFNLEDTFETARYPGFWRMARKYWPDGLAEYYRSLNKQAFAKALQKLVPEIQASDLKPGGAGVRAQALTPQGLLLDDFAIVPSQRMIHVCNVPSPAATASLVIGRQVVNMAVEEFGLT